MSPVLSLIDSAAENSVATHTLIDNVSGACAASHACMRAVPASLVNAATNSDVST